jgi:elongation factor 3
MLIGCTGCDRDKITATEKKKKLTSSEMRKKKKDRIARCKRSKEVFPDEDD